MFHSRDKYSTSPTNISQRSTTFLDQCLRQLSAEELPPAGDGSKYRDPQPDIMQRMRDLRTLHPKGDFSIKSLSSELREACGRGGRKSVRARGNRGHHENKAF